LCPLEDVGRAPEVANLIARRVSDPVLIEGHALQVRVSVGIGRFPDDADHAQSLLRKADIALYRAKRSGRGQIRFFERDMEEIDIRRALVAEALRDAIPRDEIVPHYQPLVNLATGNVIGFEVLSRWASPTLGSVAPSEFIPIVLECGLIGNLSSRVLHQACAEAARWPWPLPISFNLAPHQLCDPLLPIQIPSILSKTTLSPRRLDIEMTEKALLENDRSARTNLEALKGAGITLSLDDFGNGYASLHHLRSLPFDRVKCSPSGPTGQIELIA
jgi:predicted signal transduction protein with EAL and GGDEF domain